MSLVLPSKLNDGYTSIVAGCFVRSMPRRESSRILQTIRDGFAGTAIDEVFSPPWFHGVKSELSSQQQEVVFVTIVKNTTEIEDRQNLIRGAKMRMTDPEAADFSCALCRKVLVDHDTWEEYRRGGKTIPRLPEHELLCDTEGGCPRGHWKRGLKVFSQKNTLAWNHYWEWKLAGMPLPDCPVQRLNWALLNWVTEHGCSRKLRPTIRWAN
jgi:hypothetical protein